MAADGGLAVGAGTVLTAEQAERAVAAGARFVVSPGFDDGCRRACRELAVPVVPGVASATELMRAVRAGIDTVKLFPAEPLGGRAMLRALAAPFPRGRFVPTGGIDAARLPAYLGPPAGPRGRRQLDGNRRPSSRAGRVRGDSPADRRGRGRERAVTDVIALGEVMLRFDPGEGRIRTSRTFQVWEGGGEYNVVRGLRRCFGLRTAVVTALADNAVGRLVEDLMLQGGVDTSLIRWVPADGIGRTARNGLNFVERGFGIRGALGVSDRAGTAVSQLRKGDVDWDAVFSAGVRWFHTGGIFAGLSDTTVDVADEAMTAARRHGVTVSYDPNYRPSLWDGRGGAERAREVDLRLARHADVVVGALGLAGPCAGAHCGSWRTRCRTRSCRGRTPAAGGGARDDPAGGALGRGQRLVLGRLVGPDRVRRAARGCPACTSWTASARVTRFAAGLIYGLLTGDGDEGGSSAGVRPTGPLDAARLHRALGYGTVHGALAMTTPGDVSMASLAEVEALMAGGSAAVRR
ncbi:hypothetical protein SGRIM119S_06924 [Streptomyces griseorubiginosus]